MICPQNMSSFWGAYHVSIIPLEGVFIVRFYWNCSCRRSAVFRFFKIIVPGVLIFLYTGIFCQILLLLPQGKDTPPVVRILL